MFRFIAKPNDESWGCLQCEMLQERTTDATVLVKEGEPGQRGVTTTGMCGNHAEVFDVEDFRQAQSKFREHCE
jgi:putative aminopeptidase FrvX